MKTNIFKLIVYTILAAWSLLARPIDIRLTYEDFQNQSDYILLLSVLNIVELTEIPKDFSRIYNNGEYSIFTANCYVRSCFKGNLNTNTISIMFAQDPDCKPGFNGITPAPFYEELCLPEKYRTGYLAYLKKNSSGNFIPLTGHQDAGFSIKTVIGGFRRLYNSLNVFSVLQPRDVDDNPVLRKGERRWVVPNSTSNKVEKCVTPKKHALK